MIIAISPGMIVAGLYIYFEWIGAIYPGVFVADTPVGWMTVKRAQATLDRKWNQEKKLLVTDGESVWPMSPSDFGLHLDAEATIEQAFFAGRGMPGYANLVELLKKYPLEIPPVVFFEIEVARAQLEGAAPLLTSPLQEAALSFENGVWQGVPGKSGSVIDVESTLIFMQTEPALVMSSGYLPLVMRQQSPQIGDVARVVSLLNQYYPHPLELRAYDPIDDEIFDLEIPAQVLGGWLYLSQGEPDIQVRVNPDAVSNYLKNWSQNLLSGETLSLAIDETQLLQNWQNGKKFYVTVWHGPVDYEVQAGERLIAIGRKFGMPYWKILEANPDIDPENLIAGQKLLIPSPNEMLPLPVIASKRIVVSIAQQRLWTYENGELLQEYIISTGIDSSPTHPGVFQVQTHELNAYASVWDLYMPHFMGIYEGWPGFMNGIHGLPTLSSGRRLWEGVLGRPVSYGCIVLNLADAETLYHWAEDGVVVEITLD